MTHDHKPYPGHVGTAKEHLAGVAAARAWHQELAAKHLLDSQQPIKDEQVEKPSAAA